MKQLITLALLALAAVMPAAAQVNSGTIEAVVVDGTSLALPGVTVTVTSPDNGFTTTSVTGANGLARVQALPPGRYDVSFALDGFSPLIEKGLVVRVGQTLVVNATMQAKLTETVTVTASAPIVDVHKTDASANILPEQIETLPVADRDFQKLSFIAPTVQRERGAFRFVTGGPVVGGGGNASQGAIIVDGVDFTDPALGLATTRFSQDAIREFRVISNGSDAEIAGVSGGALSIVTRSGTNNVSGKVFGFFRDKALRARGALEDMTQPEPDFSRQQFGGTIGGPVVKDKVHYFVSFEQVNENNVTLVRPQGAYVNNKVDAPLPFDQTLLFGRVDAGLTGSQRLAAKFVYERYRQENFRVGGVADVAQGLFLNRDNYSANAEHTWLGKGNRLNQIFLSVGYRKYAEPATTPGGMPEWFSAGTTLQTGGSIYEGMLGDGTYVELRDNYTIHADTGKFGSHDVKIGGSWQYVSDRYLFDIYPNGLMLYGTDTRALPLYYFFGQGSADSTIKTHRFGLYVQDDWAVRSNVRVNLGLRYDIDTNGNLPDFVNPLDNKAPSVDRNNVQPRAALSWDIDGTGRNVVRASGGLFTGRYLLIPTHTEQQTWNPLNPNGRKTVRRLNGLALGLPPAYWLDPKNPTTTGVELPPSTTLLSSDYPSPDSAQANVGWTSRLGKTGFYFDTQFVYAHGWNEVALTNANWPGNATYAQTRKTLYPQYNVINVYTTRGRSDYKALVLSLNGTLKGGHIVTFSYTLGSKKNITDDFSPELSTGTRATRRTSRRSTAAAGPTSGTASSPPRCSASHTASRSRQSSSTARASPGPAATATTTTATPGSVTGRPAPRASGKPATPTTTSVSA